MQSLRNHFLVNISTLIILLIGLSLSGCTPGYLGGSSPPLPSDACFTGTFSDGNVSILVGPDTGPITASGWKLDTTATDPPWDYIFFDVSISGHGEARGDITLYFLPDRRLTVPDVIISLPNDGECNLRNSLTFSIAYTWEGTAYGENYSLTRQP